MSTNTSRPTSPHLQVYRLPLTGLISITHRMTGMFLSAGLLLMVYVLSALAGGAEAYAAMQAFMDNGFIKLVLAGFVFALFFHLCHGIRHLIWDAGQSFGAKTLNRYAVFELIATALLTLTTLVWGCYGL